ncbi:MAG: iron dependent repressor, metal binding and dimerization domain protein [Acidimicrobiia bacterium]
MSIEDDLRRVAPAAPDADLLVAAWGTGAEGAGPATAARVALRAGVPSAVAHHRLAVLQARGDLQGSGRYRELTAPGRRSAAAALRRARVVECLLVDVLGLSWSEAADELSAWTASLSDEAVDAAFARLGRPARCPHGNPVEADRPWSGASRLSGLAPGTTAVVDAVDDLPAPAGSHHGALQAAGVVPGARLRLVGHEPDGTDLVEVGGTVVGLPRAAAGQVRVRPVHPSGGGRGGSGRGGARG